MKEITIGSDFSGVGAFNQALQRLEIPFKEVFACDMDKFVRQTFCLNFGTLEDVLLSKIDSLGKTTITEKDYSFYYPKDVYKREIPKESLDIYMSSPPCQSFSLAGKRKGEDDKRGVLFYNTHEFIQKNKPRFFIIENVKGLLSDDSGKTFQRWIDFLGGKSVNGNPVIFPHEEAAPYHVYYQVLNAKHYGIPQNRERVFIIGIRDDEDNDFQFPKPFPLTKRLKDVLENEVDEKYFLSDKMIESITYGKKANGEVANLNKGGERGSVYSEETDAMSCLSATDYKQPKQIQIGTWRTHEDGRGFRATEDNNCPTIPAIAREDGSGQPVIKIGAIRGRNPDNPKSRKSGLETEQMLEINENGTSNALTTVQKDNVVVIKFQRTEEAKQKRKQSLANTGKDVGSFSDRQIIGVQQDFADTILANANPQKEGLIIIPTNNSKGFDKVEEEEDSINFSNPNSETRIGRVGKKVEQTLDTACNQGIYTQQRIRKLTPLECFRLMDFNDSFKWEVSDSQAYKQAGNSICVGVLVELIKKLDL